MKLASLNIWGGTIYEPLMDYLRKLSADTDIFCFQEVFFALPGAPKVSSGARMFLFQELSELLKDFTGLFELRSSGCDFQGPLDAPVSHGLAVFVRRGLLEIKSSSGKLIATVDELTDHLVKAQIVSLAYQKQPFAIINFHGIPQPGEKLDTPERISQSEKLAQIWRGLGSVPKILCGDFNLMPETQSIKILQDCGTDLIRDFNIKTTRNEVSWKRFNRKQNFADYCFTSPKIKVKDFKVPYNEVSDHLPMLLDFDLLA